MTSDGGGAARAALSLGLPEARGSMVFCDGQTRGKKKVTGALDGSLEYQGISCCGSGLGVTVIFRKKAITIRFLCGVDPCVN